MMKITLRILITCLITHICNCIKNSISSNKDNIFFFLFVFDSWQWKGFWTMALKYQWLDVSKSIKSQFIHLFWPHLVGTYLIKDKEICKTVVKEALKLGYRLIGWNNFYIILITWTMILFRHCISVPKWTIYWWSCWEFGWLGTEKRRYLHYN